jgi:hypothetical protein
MIKDVDFTNTILGQIAELRDTEIKVGFFGDENSKLVLIAGVNEFGATIKSEKARKWLFAHMKAAGIPVKSGAGQGKKFITIPERPFFRNAIDNEATKARALSLAVKAYDASGDFRRVPYAIGASFVSSIQDSIRSNIAPGNHPFTLAMKGSEKTLINNSNLLFGVTFRVDK